MTVCPENCPFSWRDLDPIYFTIPCAILSPQSKEHHDRFSRFSTGDHRVFLYFTIGARHLPQIAPSNGGSGPHLTRFLGPLRPHNPNGISIGSAVFARLTSVTDRQTDQESKQTTLLGR